MENSENLKNNLPPKKAPKAENKPLPKKPTENSPSKTEKKQASPTPTIPPKNDAKTNPQKPENNKDEKPAITTPEENKNNQQPETKPQDKKESKANIDEIHNKNENLIAESIQNNNQNTENRKRRRRLLLLLLLLLLIPILIGLGIMFYYLFRYKPPEVQYNTNIYIEEQEITKQYDEIGNEITYLPGNFVYYEKPIQVSSQLDNDNNYYPMVFRFKVSAEIDGEKIENSLGVSFEDDSIIFKTEQLPVLTVKEGKNYYTISDEYYFYCTSVVAPNVSVIKTIESLYLNPEKFTNEHANKTLHITITAESLYPTAAYFDEVWPDSDQEYRSIVIAKLENSIYG